MTKVPRLFNSFQPAHYNLHVDIDEEAMRFSGTVKINGKKVGRPSKRLTFHANGLKVTSARAVKQGRKGDQTIEFARINHHKSFQEVRLHSDNMIFPGDYIIEMTFESPITRGMTGIYPCYFTHEDQEKKLFATQFESHHAREAFPCIDEPEAKASFELKLTTENGIETLSNTPVSSQTKTPDGRLETSFEKTPLMSTYLLAFVIGEIHKKTDKTKSGVEVNAWATVAQPNSSLDFALDVAVKSIEFFEDYFDTPYPLPKADHVALPDFSSGAMENWGLITYRERVMLAYEGDSAQSTREQIALVIAHETSHQWFGNLVTMKWWNNLWLNESFANMMEYACIDRIFPEWHVWETFIASEGLGSLRRDAIHGVQAVQTDVNHPDEISSLFDPSIVYAKGGRLLYMLMNYVGEDAFRSGLTAYFKKHAYSNTTGGDLWDALSESSCKDIAAFMNPWVMRSGFPLVSVTNHKDSIEISQQHFQDDPSKADDRLWTVPLFATDLNESDFSNSSITIQKESAKPILINQGSAGHYIIRYQDEDSKKALMDGIKEQSIIPSDRLMTLNSASMLAKAGYSTSAEALQLLEAYEGESSEPVWDGIGLILAEVRRFIDQDNELEKPLKNLTAAITKRQYTRLGWEEKTIDSPADMKLRGLIIGLSIYGENPDTLTEASRLFDDFMQNSKPLPPELRSLIMSVPVRNGSDEAFNYLLSLHDNSTNSDLKNDIADALTSTRSTKNASLLLERLKDGSLVKPQDADRWLIYLMRNRYTRATAWQWMVDNWNWLENTYKQDKSYDYFPRYAASIVNTEEYAQKFHDLFDSKIDQPLLRRNIQLGSEEIDNRLAWLKRDLEGVVKRLKS